MCQRIMRLLLLSCVSVCIPQVVGALTPSPVFADSANIMSGIFAADDVPYAGGRGLITLEGISGIFLNPTSGTLRKSQLTLQYCASIEDAADGTLVEHTAMVAYGITDWIEIVALGRINDEPDAPNTAAFGPLLRIRVLKDRDGSPN